MLVVSEQRESRVPVVSHTRDYLDLAEQREIEEMMVIFRRLILL